MSIPKIQSLGVQGMIEQPEVFSYRQGAGYETTRRWEGRTGAQGLFQQLIASGFDAKMTNNGPIFIVEGTFGGDPSNTQEEVPTNTWERSENRIEKTIFEHENIVSDLTVHNIAVLQKQCDDKAFKDFGYDSPEQAALAAPWFDIVMKGQVSFILYQSVVRLNLSISSQFDKNKLINPDAPYFIDRNVGRILTRAQMIELEGAPEWVLKTPVVPEEFPFPAIAGFFKTEPQINQEAKNKWSVVLEWEEGVWLDKIYRAATKTGA